jgi:hypothetical protein
LVAAARFLSARPTISLKSSQDGTRRGHRADNGIANIT